MAAVDMARNSRYYSDADIGTAPVESPARERMGPSDHLNADQFGTNAITSTGVRARRPNYIGGVPVHAWRDGAINDNESEH
jgi:hypothetical protein